LEKRKKASRVYLVMLLCLLNVFDLEASVKRREFTVDLLIELSQPTTRAPLHLSPDGRKLIVNVQHCRRVRDLGGDRSYTAAGIPKGMVESRTLVVDSITGIVQEPFPTDATSWGAQWSPDGTRLAAYVQYQGQACLGVWERASERYTLYPHILVRPFFGFEVPRWTPDNRSVIVKLLATSLPNKRNFMDATENAHAEVATTFSFVPEDDVFSNDTGPRPLPGWADGYLCNLACIDVTTGKVQQLAEDWRIMGGWKVAPDGHTIAVLRYTSHEPKLQQFYFDLTLLSLDNGTSRVLAHHIPQDYGMALSWSPDSRFLAYLVQLRAANTRLFVVSAHEATDPQELSASVEELELLQEDVEAPRWSEDGQYLYCLARRGCWEFAIAGNTQRFLPLSVDREIIGWLQPPTSGTLWTPGSDTLLYLTRNQRTKDTGLVLANMSSGEGTLLTEFSMRPGWSSFEMEASTDRSSVYLCLEGSDHPAEVWQFSNGYQQRKQLFSLNAQLEAVAMGTSRLLEYRTLDGERRQAALLLPAEYTEGSSVPVVVIVYGGSMQSNALHCFGVTHDLLHGQLLASHGYAVLCPDIPLKNRDPLAQLPGQVLPAITHLIDLGIAHPKRIGLMGHSYGGYCTLALLVQTDIFSVAVASAGFYNLISTYLTLRENGSDGWLGWCESGQGRMDGPLWEKRDAYIENSPIFYLDRVQTPVLLTCGSQDLVPPTQAEEVFVGLRRLAKKVVFRRYEGEDHWPGRWSEQSYQDLCAYVLAWLDEHLKE
jgi:dipeptidyl aminopeptidase/acylaminoacyl peptidase